jgi:hypothetical protein
MLNYYINERNSLFWAAIKPCNLTESHLTRLVANFRSKQRETNTTAGRIWQRRSHPVHIQSEGACIPPLMALKRAPADSLECTGMAASREKAMLVSRLLAAVFSFAEIHET